MTKRIDALRPESLDGYIGQKAIKDVLSISIEAAMEENRVLDHILINGPPGLGKTTLARIIANEMESRIHTAIGPAMKTSKDIQGFVSKARERDHLFIDEVHRMSKPAAEVLYPIMEDGHLLFTINNRSIEIQLPPITIIGATTNMGALAQPFMDRFGLQFQLEFYSYGEMVELVLINSEKIGLDTSQEALEAIIDRSRFTPRIANRLLRRLHDYEVALGTHFTKHQVGEIFWKKFGIDHKGLIALDRKVLKSLKDQRGPVGIEALATLVREEPATIEERIEPYLLQIGFMERLTNGRRITELGSAHLRQLALKEVV